MKKIQTKISLEDFKSRRSINNLPYLDNGKRMFDGNTYGKIPYDLVVYDGNILKLKDNLPIISYNNKNILRYRTMMNAYYRICKDIKAFVYYQLCNRDGGRLWVEAEYKFPSVYPYYSSLPYAYAEAYSIGDIICVSEDSVYLNSKFIIDGTHYEFVFKDYVEAQLSSITEGISIPFTTVRIPLTTTMKSNGNYECAVEKWIAGKKYYLGEFAYDDEGVLYRLKKCTEYDTVAVQYNPARVGGDAKWVDISSKKNITFTLDDNANYYLKKYLSNKTYLYYVVNPYYRGYYDKTTNTTKMNQYYGSNWLKVSDLTDEEEKDIEIICGGDSVLSTLKREKIELDDSGNKLPFNVVKDIDDMSASTIEEMSASELAEAKKIKDTCIPYFVDTVICSSELGYRINDISFADDVSEWTTKNQVICCKDLTISSGIVTFNYTVDANVDEGETVYGTGINYIESYPFEIRTYDDFVYEEQTYTGLQYIYIDYDNPILNDSGFTATKKYKIKSGSNEWLDKLPLYMDDFKIGFADSEKSISISLTRGKDAAYERHNILSEINTFQDLKNYRNNYFQITDN